MNDKFEDKIRESLNNPPDYPFEERIWQDMEKRLDQATENHKGGGYVAWWIPLLAAAVPLLLFVWLWGAYDQQRTELTALKTVISQSSVLQTDTLIQRQLTIVYDTIYRTVITETQNRMSFTPSHEKQFATSSLAQSSAAGRYYSPSQVYLQPLSRWNENAFSSLLNPYTLPLNPQSKETEKPIIETGAQTNEGTSPDFPLWQNPVPVLPVSLSLLQYNNSVPLPELVLPVIKNRKKRVREILTPILPSSFKIGLTVGTLAAGNLPEIEDRANFNAVLLAEFAYGRHLSFVFGGEYLANNFNLQEGDDVDFSEFPILPPNNSGDELERLEGDFRYWQFPLGIKYHFMVQRRFSPHLGLGLAGVRPTESRLSYEYEDSSDNYYLLSQDNLLARDLIFQDAWLLVGTEYYLGSNWNLLLDISGQWSFREANSALEKREFLKARLGVGYSF